MKTIEERIALAKQGLFLEKLVDDENWEVRCEVALQGYELEKLANDHHELVRKEAYELIGRIAIAKGLLR